ncbi:3-oxo-5-alpha-steroid 4-dehydrogenase 1 [Sesamum alatum]|uniref:3-oxo-5-alpha-steroid 4-dehydrogenase 1 n=1 Tax=Sesamum alatum TaxID=300844 RepID=A0AAE1YT13_9LAMI|nr:3-oxo-5-alpha-steroid 4-dehydrogenase 1 [Sesamum alatum]
MAKMVESFVFEEASSTYTKAFYGLTLLGLCYLGISEAIGKHLNYSKFWNSSSSSNKSTQILLPSKVGMLMAYTPSLLAGVSSFWVFSDGGGIRVLMLKSAITLHFLKRDLEHRVEGFPEPLVDLKYVGVLMFLVGVIGNFYHHYLLSKLRDENDKDYKIPRGGLFSLVICPHYLFEILTFIGISFISQTLFSYLCSAGSATYLLIRSCATKNWYLSKFEDFPKNVKALIPYVV